MFTTEIHRARVCPPYHHAGRDKSRPYKIEIGDLLIESVCTGGSGRLAARQTGTQSTFLCER